MSIGSLSDKTQAIIQKGGNEDNIKGIMKKKKDRKKLLFKKLNITTRFLNELHKESNECVVSDLDLTATPPTQTSVEDARVLKFGIIYTL